MTQYSFFKKRTGWLTPRLLLSGLIFAAALWLYTATAVPGLIVRGGIESESAELQRAAYRLGIAHSTGYPIHTLIGYLAGQIGEVLHGDPYTWITYTSALASALGLVMFFQLTLRVASPPAALGATFLLAVTNTVWHLSTITETQALHFLIGIGLVWAIYEHIRAPERFWPLGLLAVLIGVGLANHRTTVIHLAVVGITGLLVGAWRRWTLRRWALLIFLAMVPLLSYGYLFVRAQDPHVVFSTRPTLYPADLTTQDVIGVIQGKLQNGQGAEINLEFPTDDFLERLRFVVENVADEISAPGFLVGALGLIILAVRNWRTGVMFAVYSSGWLLFLMSWRLDWKATIYQHVLVMPLVLGMAVVASPGMTYFQRKWRWLPAVWAILSLPIFALVVSTFTANRIDRDLSGDDTGAQFWAQYEKLPSGSIVYPGGWAAETFILLEYLDESGRRDIDVRDSRFDGDILQAARDPSRSVYITPFLRGLFGLYGGSTVIAEQDVAFSGTYSDLLLQIRPPDDPRVLEEAAAETVTEAELAPEILLYSYHVEESEAGIQLGVYWQVLAETANWYSVYAHLRYYDRPCAQDGSERLLTQDDAYAPVDGTYPTIFWNAAEVVKDTYLIPWPDESVPQENLAIAIGMTLNGERQGEFCIPLIR